MKEYLVIDYTDCKIFGKGKLSRVFEKELWELVDKAKKEGLNIAVFELGECVLDWS